MSELLGFAVAQALRALVLRIAGDVLEHPDAAVVRRFDVAREIANRVVSEVVGPEAAMRADAETTLRTAPEGAMQADAETARRTEAGDATQADAETATHFASRMRQIIRDAITKISVKQYMGYFVNEHEYQSDIDAIADRVTAELKPLVKQGSQCYQAPAHKDADLTDLKCQIPLEIQRHRDTAPAIIQRVRTMVWHAVRHFTEHDDVTTGAVADFVAEQLAWFLMAPNPKVTNE